VKASRVRSLVAFAAAGAVGLSGVVGLVGAGPAAGSVVSSASMASSASTLRVGDVTLKRCRTGGAAVWCGSVRVPLDRTDPSAGRISIGFGWVPSSGPASGTVVAEEGGPGYPSTGTAPDYLDMIGSLHRTRNLLVVDLRGTGRSALLDCAGLQSYRGSTATARFERLVADCGNHLNHTYRRADGTFVHASDLFGTANDARDLADVIGHLHLGPVDLYGDSYGTYFSQSFLSRYPQLLRSVVLDSAYEARDLDPWYVTTVTTARTAFEAACTRALACDAAAGTGAWQRIGRLAAAVRAHPVHGRVPGVDATLVPTTVGIRQLVDLVNDAGYDYGVYRSLDAAGRALLERHDPTPLLRLWAEDFGYDDGDYDGPVTAYSDGTFFAVGCTDYPQLFDMSATPAVRRQQLAAAITALPANTFAPFTTAEWIQMNQFTEAYTGCLDWPAPTHPADPAVAPGVPMDATNVPVLVLNGDIDSLTPAVGGAHVARQIGSAARSVVVPNMVHLVALDDRYGCGASIYRAFVRRPDRLATLDTSCAATVPEVHALGSFSSRLAQVAPATVTSGRVPLLDRRLAAVVVAAAGDAAYRYQYVDADDDLGLRGGTVHYGSDASGEVITAHLHGVRWTDDTWVDGSLTTDYYGLGVVGTVLIHDAEGHRLTVHVRWSTTGPHTIAHVAVGGGALTLPAS
jgi:pimeloyl-ACP methyl ester carboxylesterase